MLVASTSVFGVHCTTPAARLLANAAIAASRVAVRRRVVFVVPEGECPYSSLPYRHCRSLHDMA